MGMSTIILNNYYHCIQRLRINSTLLSCNYILGSKSVTTQTTEVKIRVEFKPGDYVGLGLYTKRCLGLGTNHSKRRKKEEWHGKEIRICPTPRERALPSKTYFWSCEF